eukprot:768253-Hanusia_phi.AAC.7
MKPTPPPRPRNRPGPAAGLDRECWPGFSVTVTRSAHSDSSGSTESSHACLHHHIWRPSHSLCPGQLVRLGTAVEGEVGWILLEPRRGSERTEPITEDTRARSQVLRDDVLLEKEELHTLLRNVRTEAKNLLEQKRNQDKGPREGSEN